MKSGIFTAAILFAILAAAPAQAALLKGPYLQTPTTDGMTVCVQTDADAAVVVEYGLTSSYGQTAAAPFADSLDFPNQGTHFVYKIRAQGLDAGTLYHYRVTVGGEPTPDGSFVTAPEAGTDFNIAFFGDTRGGSTASPNLDHEAVIAGVRGLSPMMYFNTGDLGSSGGNPADWDYYFSVEAPLMAESPLWPAFGNHESSPGIPSGDREWKHYFATPNADNPTWYSFDYGNIHFVVLDVTKGTTLLANGAQNQWLQADLAAYHNNPATNFLIGVMHYPAFTWAQGRTPDPITANVVDPLLRDNGVDIVISGHDHFYARADMEGVPHVVTGGGGAPLYDFQAGIELRPIYRASAKEYHYIDAQVSANLIHFDVYSATTGAVLDTFEVTAHIAPTDDDTSDDAGDDSDDDFLDDAGDDADDTGIADDAGNDDDVAAADDDDSSTSKGCGCGC